MHYLSPLALLVVFLALSGCANAARTGGAWSPSPNVRYDEFRDSTDYLAAPILASNRLFGPSVTLIAGWRCPKREACVRDNVMLVVNAQQDGRIPLEQGAELFVMMGERRERFTPALEEFGVRDGMLGQDWRSLAYPIPASLFRELAEAPGDVQMRAGGIEAFTLPHAKREGWRLLLARGTN